MAEETTADEVEMKTGIIKGALRSVVNEFNDHGILSVENVYYATDGVDVRRVIADFRSIGWSYSEALEYLKFLGVNFMIYPTENGYMAEPTDNKYFHNLYKAIDKHQGTYTIKEDDGTLPTLFMQVEFFEEEDAVNVCKEALLDMIHDAIKEFAYI